MMLEMTGLSSILETETAQAGVKMNSESGPVSMHG